MVGGGRHQQGDGDRDAGVDRQGQLLPGPLDITDAIAIALTRLADARLEEAMAR